MSIGFIGLGVMGEPMCRNLAVKSGRPVLAHDLSPEPLARLAPHGVRAAGSLAAIAEASETVFLSLPSGREVEAVCRTPDGLLAHLRPGAVLADLGTTPVALTRALAADFAARGVAYADAPVARTREAAEQGTLSIMVGTETDETFARLSPLLACMASEITRCGGVGAGQVVKIMNNMVLFQTVAALCEALALARGAGVDGTVLFAALGKGSADSFALRNHGMKSVLPGRFPERAFSARYARKDIACALELARAGSIAAEGAERVARLLDEAIAAGDGDAYWPVIARRIR